MWTHLEFLGLDPDKKNKSEIKLGVLKRILGDLYILNIIGTGAVTTGRGLQAFSTYGGDKGWFFIRIPMFKN